MPRLDELAPRPGSAKRGKRVGRGYGSGRGGHESGRGTKGQGSRSGVNQSPGFEGGQTPIWMRFPKRGFKNPSRVEYAVVNVQELDRRFEDGEEVSLEELVRRRVVREAKAGLKVLGRGELTKSLTVRASRFSAAAREKIAAAGGVAEEV
ncbi:MAG: 50S ribosomal protein L15 [Candidatus Bipolaricaulota bacterium]